MISHEDEQTLLAIESQNVKRIERLEINVGEIKEDIAALPGKIIAAISQDHKKDNTWQWAFGIIVVALGSGFLLLHNQDANMRSEIGHSIEAMGQSLHEHTKDRHPTRVEAEVKELRAQLNVGLAAIEWLTKEAHGSATWRGTMTERTELLIQGMVKSMELGGQAGRDSSENRGRVDAEIRSLQQQLKTKQ